MSLEPRVACGARSRRAGRWWRLRGPVGGWRARAERARGASEYALVEPDCQVPRASLGCPRDPGPHWLITQGRWLQA